MLSGLRVLWYYLYCRITIWRYLYKVRRSNRMYT